MQETQAKIQACESLIQEHRQMEILLERLRQALTTNSDLKVVKAIMSEIESHINTHFACEEKVLFPAVSPYHSMVLMEAEHEELIELREEILVLLNSGNNAEGIIEQLNAKGNRFISEMLDHIGREEAGIFPTCERSLSDDEKQCVIAGMEKIRQQAMQEPIPTISRPERVFETYSVNLLGDVSRKIFSKRIFEDDTLEAKQITIQAGESLAAHWSPKKAIIICLAGEGTYVANEQDVLLTTGTIISMSPQLRHAIFAKSTCTVLLLLEN